MIVKIVMCGNQQTLIERRTYYHLL